MMARDRLPFVRQDFVDVGPWSHHLRFPVSVHSSPIDRFNAATTLGNSGFFHRSVGASRAKDAD